MLLLCASDLSIGDAALLSLIGISIVFVVLFLLMLIIQLLGIAAEKSPALAAKLPKLPKFGKKTEETKTDSAEPVNEPVAAGTCGDLVLINTEERDAAMIMAIVADSTATPLNELRFKSIKRVDEEK